MAADQSIEAVRTSNQKRRRVKKDSTGTGMNGFGLIVGNTSLTTGTAPGSESSAGTIIGTATKKAQLARSTITRWAPATQEEPPCGAIRPGLERAISDQLLTSSSVKHRQVVEAAGYARVLQAQGFFPDCQHTEVSRPRKPASSPTTIVRPSGPMAQLSMPLSPVKVAICSPLSRSQSRSVQSSEPDRL
jgi:hypothetical protein